MILFHGTIESNLKSIKKHGILDATQDQWITEVTRSKVCCVGSQPTAGAGGQPCLLCLRQSQSESRERLSRGAQVANRISSRKSHRHFRQS